eukprot:265268-Chlamydomonas_euryale.AAC.2
MINEECTARTAYQSETHFKGQANPNSSSLLANQILAVTRRDTKRGMERRNSHGRTKRNSCVSISSKILNLPPPPKKTLSHQSSAYPTPKHTQPPILNLTPPQTP